MNRLLNKTATISEDETTTVSEGETESVEYEYDSFGNVEKMIDATGTTIYTYNDYNLLSKITNPDNSSISYSYNNMKQLAGVLNYDDEYIEYTYDLMGNVSTISIDDEVVAEYTYNDKNMLAEVNYPGEGSTTYEYDWRLRLNNLTNKLADESVINSYAYTYDSAGNQTRKTETVGTQTKITNYTYDDLNRLSSYTAPDGTVTTYTFDTRNNITRESIVHPESYEFTYSYYGDDYELCIWDVTNHTIDYTYDSANRLLTETESLVAESGYGDGTFNGTNTYTYDSNRNSVTKRASGDYDTSIEYDYSFDAFNRLKSIHEDWTYYGDYSVTTYDYTYEYNGNNELSKITSFLGNSQTDVEKYYWDRSYIVKDNSSTYYLGVDGVFAQSNGTNMSYLLKNAHGDTVRLVRNGSVIKNMDYDPYGKQTESSTYLYDSAYKYANYYYDSNSGFYYLRNRFYDPSIGRFISEDPVHDGMNWYAYAGNNPIMFVDPWGLYKLEVDENGNVYAIIEDGDTLYSIAKSEVGNGESWKDIVYNGNPNNIQVGEKININGLYNKCYPRPITPNKFYDIIIGDYKIKVALQKNVIRTSLVDGDAEKFLKKRFDFAVILALYEKKFYKEVYGEEIDISDMSLAFELLGHLYPKLLLDKLGISDKITNANVVDSGTKSVDDNRVFWDRLSDEATFEDYISLIT